MTTDYPDVENHERVTYDWRWRNRSKILRLSRTKKRKTHNYKCQMEEPRAYEALLASDESAGGSASSEVHQREDRRVEAHRSLVDAGVPLGR